MKKYCKFLYALPIVAALLAHSACQANNEMKVDNSTVKELDIQRYMGKWCLYTERECSNNRC